MRTNFNMTDENITMIKGDTVSFNIIVTDDNGDPITVDSAYFTAKKNPTDVTPSFQKSLGSGITQEDGILTVRIAPSDTASLYEGLYFYDCQIGIDPDKFTLLRGILTLEQDVTTN